jgi:hypothetical protein
MNTHYVTKASFHDLWVYLMTNMIVIHCVGHQQISLTSAEVCFFLAGTLLPYLHNESVVQEL